ncbi:hypothetical protein CHS0354_019229 [Potamilus streckersoni]|uniref:Uncharacterized protein n=1 Tax=Potamilus streckersoni TaxID=2493646 RepID=A0AAE0SZL2_9BIVA|nr:hypothetical protein CHS0354_019229 [Potamilus streckersoni]
MYLLPVRFSNLTSNGIIMLCIASLAFAVAFSGGSAASNTNNTIIETTTKRAWLSEGLAGSRTWKKPPVTEDVGRTWLEKQDCRADKPASTIYIRPISSFCYTSSMGDTRTIRLFQWMTSPSVARIPRLWRPVTHIHVRAMMNPNRIFIGALSQPFASHSVREMLRETCDHSTHGTVE